MPPSWLFYSSICRKLRRAPEQFHGAQGGREQHGEDREGGHLHGDAAGMPDGAGRFGDRGVGLRRQGNLRHRENGRRRSGLKSAANKAVSGPIRVPKPSAGLHHRCKKRDKTDDRPGPLQSQIVNLSVHPARAIQHREASSARRGFLKHYLDQVHRRH